MKSFGAWLYSREASKQKGKYLAMIISKQKNPIQHLNNLLEHAVNHLSVVRIDFDKGRNLIMYDYDAAMEEIKRTKIEVSLLKEFIIILKRKNK